MKTFDTHTNSGGYLMKVNNLSVGLNMPEALKSIGEGKEEQPHSLPPYRARKAFLVDEYPACPKDWLRSSGRIKSYFVPIIENAGLWLDFNHCLGTTPNHVAIVVSAQGINAITGLPCKTASLEQYKDECPKHKKPFGPDRLCTECGHKWAKQNYLTSTGQPNGQLWLDGFRAEDGFIRQYVFTKNKMRGVANAVIGEDRVFALGISYFLSKEQRPAPPVHNTRITYNAVTNWGDDTPIGSAGGSSLGLMDMMSHTESETKYTCSCGPAGATGASGPPGAAGAINDSKGSLMSAGGLKYRSAKGAKLGGAMMKRSLMSSPGDTVKYASSFPEVSTKVTDHSQILPSTQVFMANAVQVEQLEIAAGARIEQRIYDDPNSLDFWQAEPEGLIVVNYCTEEDADKIIAAGKIDLSGHPEGFMAKIPVGNK